MSYNKKNNFVSREFEEVEGGHYEDGFYFTPDGSKSNIILIICIKRLLG